LELDSESGFDPRHSELDSESGYYEFKPEITTKELIRNFTGDVSSDVIKQLERWWDKYQISLHELDDQVATAETVMKGYLKELGYE